MQNKEKEEEEKDEEGRKSVSVEHLIIEFDQLRKSILETDFDDETTMRSIYSSVSLVDNGSQGS